MFKKSAPAKKPSEQPEPAPGPALKFEHPKILLIDLDDVVKATLEKEGYNVAVGTFGTPYKVGKHSGYEPVVVKASLPNYTEQEIIVVDLVPGEPTPDPPAEKSKPMEELDWWAKCSNGVIDPRPRAMAMVHDQFDRILQNGGAFVVFSDGRDKQELVWARNYRRYDGLSIDQEIHYNNWSFLSILSNLEVSDDHGEEITPVQENWPLARLLADHIKGATFCCTLEAGWHVKDEWGVGDIFSSLYTLTLQQYAAHGFDEARYLVSTAKFIRQLELSTFFRRSFVANIIRACCGINVAVGFGTYAGLF